MAAVTIPKGFRVTPKQFDELAESNHHVRMELTAKGKLIILNILSHIESVYSYGGRIDRRSFSEDVYPTVY